MNLRAICVIERLHKLMPVSLDLADIMEKKCGDSPVITFALTLGMWVISRGLLL